jgi:hypothetical protein
MGDGWARPVRLVPIASSAAAAPAAYTRRPRS